MSGCGRVVFFSVNCSCASAPIGTVIGNHSCFFFLRPLSYVIYCYNMFPLWGSSGFPPYYCSEGKGRARNRRRSFSPLTVRRARPVRHFIPADYHRIQNVAFALYVVVLYDPYTYWTSYSRCGLEKEREKTKAFHGKSRPDLWKWPGVVVPICGTLLNLHTLGFLSRQSLFPNVRAVPRSGASFGGRRLAPFSNDNPPKAERQF